MEVDEAGKEDSLGDAKCRDHVENIFGDREHSLARILGKLLQFVGNVTFREDQLWSTKNANSR
jgi:hypothetical protein